MLMFINHLIEVSIAPLHRPIANLVIESPHSIFFIFSGFYLKNH